jgi:hypothetical protein
VVLQLFHIGVIALLARCYCFSHVGVAILLLLLLLFSCGVEVLLALVLLFFSCWCCCYPIDIVFLMLVLLLFLHGVVVVLALATKIFNEDYFKNITNIYQNMTSSFLKIYHVYTNHLQILLFLCKIQKCLAPTICYQTISFDNGELCLSKRSFIQ